VTGWRGRRALESQAAIPAMPETPGADVAAVLGPARIHSRAAHLRLGDGWAATLIITGYPSEVGMAWLEPLLAWPGRLDVAIHIDPLPTPAAVSRLRKQRARLESARRIDADRGRLDDPLIEATAADAADLADLIARGESRLFEVGIYLTVHAHTRHELTEAAADVRAAAASVLLDTQPATWRQVAGWCSTLPLGHDGLGLRRVMDTDALAASFPLGSPDLPGPLPGEGDPVDGVLYGLSPSGGTVWWDRWACDNHNSVVLAHSGAGKSYLMKLEVLRNLYTGVQVAVIDPEDEYVPLADAVGGRIVQLGAPGVRLNPLDIPAGDVRPDALTRRALFLHTLITVLLGEQPPPAERAALDAAITTCYATAGITHDPSTWTRPAPLLSDLAATLTHPDDGHRGLNGGHGQRDGHDGQRPVGQADTGNGGHHDSGRGQTGEEGHHGGRGRTSERSDATAAAATLAARLAPWITGSFRDLFDGPTTVSTSGHLVVWSTRHLPDELRAAGMLLALDAIWRDIDTPTTRTPATGNRRTSGLLTKMGDRLAHRLGSWVPNPLPATANHGAPSAGNIATSTVPRRLVVVDEAWALMREREGARFLARMAKSARKRRAGLAVVTQDAADLLASDLGQVVVANAATQILMRQAPQAIDEVATTFALTAGEARLLLSAAQGQALLLAGSHRIAFQPIASDSEHALVTDGLEADRWSGYPRAYSATDEWSGPPNHAPTASPAAHRSGPEATVAEDDDFWGEPDA